MQGIHQLFHSILHIDTYLIAFVSTYGLWTYLALFAIIFCETGLVITPFLPGDSLLFATGSLAAQQNTPLNGLLLLGLLIVASVAGNQVNYLIGKTIGPQVFSANHPWLLNKKYLIAACQFYEKHGRKTIIFARFIPIIRTFAPFVAGVGSMNFSSFTLYNLVGALLWVGGLLGFGYFFGSIPIIKDHFSLVIYGIIVLSLLPPFLALLYRKISTSYAI